MISTEKAQAAPHKIGGDHEVERRILAGVFKRKE
jgi:hypothetical protein